MKKIFFLNGIFVIILITLSGFLNSARPDESQGVNAGMLKMNEGLDEMKSGNYKKALDIFLHCFDNAAKYGKNFYDIRNSFLLIYLKRINKNYSNTHNELKKRFNRLLKIVSAGSFKENEIKPLPELAKILHIEKKLLGFYLSNAKNLRKRSDKEIFTNVLYDLLFKNKRYKEIYENIDLIANAKTVMKNLNNDNSGFKEMIREGTAQRLAEYKKIMEFVGDKKGGSDISNLLKYLK